jgi:ABC-type Mn2+/Zn2+ transport system ATPase subunit
MLNVNNLNQYYGGSHILRGVSFTAEAGKVTTLLGRNGVGKTTLLKTLMGLRADRQRQHFLRRPGHHPRAIVPARQGRHRLSCRRGARSFRA